MLNLLLLFPSVIAATEPEQRGWGWNPLQWLRHRSEFVAKEDRNAQEQLSASTSLAFDAAENTIKGAGIATHLFFAPWYELVGVAGDFFPTLTKHLPTKDKVVDGLNVAWPFILEGAVEWLNLFQDVMASGQTVQPIAPETVRQMIEEHVKNQLLRLWMA